MPNSPIPRMPENQNKWGQSKWVCLIISITLWTWGASLIQAYTVLDFYLWNSGKTHHHFRWRYPFSNIRSPMESPHSHLSIGWGIGWVMTILSWILVCIILSPSSFEQLLKVPISEIPGGVARTRKAARREETNKLLFCWLLIFVKNVFCQQNNVFC